MSEQEPAASSRKPPQRKPKGARQRSVTGDIERGMIGGIGALIPVLAVLDAGGLAQMGPNLYLKGIIAFGVGAVIAWAQPEVTNRFGVIQIGMSVPALLASLIVSGEARYQKNLVDAGRQQPVRAAAVAQPSVDSGASPATDPRGGSTLRRLLGPTVVHAQAKDNTIPTFPKPSVGVLEYLGLAARRNFYVVVGSYPVLSAAQNAAKTLSRKMRASVYRLATATGELYSVVIGENLTYGEATALRDSAIKSGLPRSTHVWAVDLPPAPPTPVCDKQEIEENKWKDFSSAFDRPVYAYAGNLDGKAATFRIRLAFPPKPLALPKEKHSEADFEKLTAGANGSWLTFAFNAPTQPPQTLEVGASRFEVAIPKIDLGTVTDDDLDVRVCLVS